jgi:hypothetical protein
MPFSLGTFQKEVQKKRLVVNGILCDDTSVFFRMANDKCVFPLTHPNFNIPYLRALAKRPTKLTFSSGTLKWQFWAVDANVIWFFSAWQTTRI